jgi:hypothetical protein
MGMRALKGTWVVFELACMAFVRESQRQGNMNCNGNGNVLPWEWIDKAEMIVGKWVGVVL